MRFWVNKPHYNFDTYLVSKKMQNGIKVQISKFKYQNLNVKVFIIKN